MTTDRLSTNAKLNQFSPATFKMALSMIIFGSVGFFSQHTGLPALELVFIRCVAASLFLGFLWVVTGGAKREVWHKREVIQIMICGLFLILNWVYLFKTIEYSGVTIAISLYHLAPVIVLFLGAFIYKESLTLPVVLAMLFCFIGIIAIALDKPSGGVQTEFLSKGIIWGILSAVFYALLTLTGKGIHKMSAYATTLLQVVLGVVMLSPFVDFSAFSDLTASNWAYITVTGFLHTGIVFYLFFASIRELSTQTISILVFLDPLVAIFMDLFITGFMPSFYQWIGVLLIFGGMALTLLPKRYGQ